MDESRLKELRERAPALAALYVTGHKAIAAAADVEALEQARVAVLGRKSPLTEMLRSISTLPAEERPVVGKFGNVVRVELEALVESREAELASEALQASLAGERIDVTLPGVPLPLGHEHLITRTIREVEDIFVGLGYQVADGPEIETDYYNFTALNTPADHPARSLHDTFYIDEGGTGRRACCAPQTSPRRRCASHGGAGAARLRHLSRQDLPARPRRHAHADVPPGRGPGRRRGHHHGRPQGHAASLRARVLRRRPRDPPAAALLPLHRAERRGRRALPAVRRRGLPLVQALGLARDPRRRHGRPQRVRLRRLRRRPLAGLRLRHRRRAHGHAQARHPRPARASTTTTFASWSSSDESPVQLAARLRRLGPFGRGTRRAAAVSAAPRSSESTGSALRATPRTWRCSAWGACSPRSSTPTPTSSALCTVDVGEASGGVEQIVCGADNFAAGDTVAVSLAGAAARERPQAAQGQPARRRVRRHDAFARRSSATSRRAPAS